MVCGGSQEQFHTYREIMSQPETWAETIDNLEPEMESAHAVLKGAPVDTYLFTGCGTSFHLATAAAALFREILGMPTTAIPASEVYLAPDWVMPPKGRGVLFAISRSGNTTETLLAADYFHRNRCGPVIGLTCEKESALPGKADACLVLSHAAEDSIVMTRSFTNILLAMQLIAGSLAQDQSLRSELERLPDLARRQMGASEDMAKRLARDLDLKHYVYLGLGAYYGLACEASLKMKEMTQVASEAYSPLEYRHGPISVIGPGSAAVLLCTERGKRQVGDVTGDIMNMGGKVLVIGDDIGDIRADWRLALDSGLRDRSRAILYMLPLQMLAYERALTQGLNPDRPRHLGHVVVLEDL